jgi:peptidoglycan/LPS O-acetylase OafA/YrhL
MLIASCLFLGVIAIAWAALIPRPWLRATIIAAITGLVGIVVASSMYETHGPGQWLKQLALGWFFGVMAGSLLGVVVFRIRAKEWPSDDASAPGSALLLLFAFPLVVVVLFTSTTLIALAGAGVIAWGIVDSVVSARRRRVARREADRESPPATSCGSG